MPDAVIPLSVGNIKQLQQQLKQFARALKDSVVVDIEQGTCAEIATLVREKIADIADVDGNYLGSDNPNASVVIEVGLPGHDVIWRGKQIAYLEFGTGKAGVGYPGPAMGQAGYAPDPTKKTWAYDDAKLGKGTVSHGLEFQAPMYKTAAVLRMGEYPYPAAKAILRKAARDAVTL
jgi:hypothetical protein